MFYPKETKKMTPPTITEKYIGSMTTVSIGSFVGYASGLAIKRVGSIILVFVGIICMILPTAKHYDLISIDWNKISMMLVQKVDIDNDGCVTENDLKVYIEKFKKIMTKDMPGSAGFTVGLVTGFRS